MWSRMPKKFKQVVKGFRDSLFRGSSLSASKKEQLYRSLHPELQGQPLGFQRGDDEDEDQDQDQDQDEDEDEDEDEVEGGGEEAEAGGEQGEGGGGDETEAEAGGAAEGGDEAEAAPARRPRKFRRPHAVQPPPVPSSETGKTVISPEKVFQVNAYRLVKEALYEARIQATCMYYQQILGQKMNKKTGASSIYLREEEYRKVVVPWMSNRPEAYAAWCGVWASEAFQQKSKSHRDNRGTMPNHTFGGDNFTRKAKRLEAQLGREPTPIEVWEAGHRGSDPSNPLCSQTQRERLVSCCPQYSVNARNVLTKVI
ncbi:uncharacterized protein [Zea mays]|uniref:uncharacterized protein n=1 Tax=Zea mays TaxID=4577 RepID=UPI0009A9BB00|nr:uncharacterized protein LOC103645163 [Zea mays]|eukprot:XP_020398683.1 uncharacterized protein LOC103645163 [Zea mays]